MSHAPPPPSSSPAPPPPAGGSDTTGWNGERVRRAVVATLVTAGLLALANLYWSYPWWSLAVVPLVAPACVRRDDTLAEAVVFVLFVALIASGAWLVLRAHAPLWLRAPCVMLFWSLLIAAPLAAHLRPRAAPSTQGETA